MGHSNDVPFLKWKWFNDGNYLGSASLALIIKSITDIRLLNTVKLLIIVSAHVDKKINILDAQNKNLFIDIKENIQQKEVRSAGFNNNNNNNNNNKNIIKDEINDK